MYRIYVRTKKNYECDIRRDPWGDVNDSNDGLPGSEDSVRGMDNRGTPPPAELWN